VEVKRQAAVNGDSGVRALRRRGELAGGTLDPSEADQHVLSVHEHLLGKRETFSDQPARRR
jgi:hypothetical protein